MISISFTGQLFSLEQASEKLKKDIGPEKEKIVFEEIANYEKKLKQFEKIKALLIDYFNQLNLPTYIKSLSVRSGQSNFLEIYFSFTFTLDDQCDTALSIKNFQDIGKKFLSEKLEFLEKDMNLEAVELLLQQPISKLQDIFDRMETSFQNNLSSPGTPKKIDSILHRFSFTSNFSTKIQEESLSNKNESKFRSKI